MPFVYYVMLSVVEASPGRVPCEMGAEHGSCTHYKNGRRSAMVCVWGPAEELPIWERLMPRAASPIVA